MLTFCWLWKGPVMFWSIPSKWSIFWTLLWDVKLYRIEFPSKWEVLGKFLRKYEEVMISQSSVDFSLRNPNLESLTFEQILSFLDESWSTLDQMMNVNLKWGCWPKIRKFDCMLTIVDFLTNTTDFQPSEQLSEETWLVRLETWHGESLRHMRRHENHWRC